MKLALNPALVEILRPAYGPCPEFSGACRADMRWAPEQGHVPRGFRGATGSLDEIELVLVVAEPGDPLPGESHTGLESAYEYSGSAFQRGATQFHQNVKYILNGCWPELSYEQQMRRVWMTESVLCSAPKEAGHVRTEVCSACGNRYLVRQLELLRHALVVALGAKARDRMKRLGIQGFMEAGAVAPPGCNRATARQSWDAVIKAVRARR